MADMAGGLVARVLLVVVGNILLIAVAIPVVNDTIVDANLTGTTGTIVGFVPVFLAIGALVLSASFIGIR